MACSSSPSRIRRYFLLFLPLAALVAARALLWAIETLGTAAASARPKTWPLMGGAISASVVAAFLRTHPTIVALYWSAAVIRTWVILYTRISGLATAFFLVSITIAPMTRLHSWFAPQWSNADQLDEVRYVLSNTVADDTVMDGFTGTRDLRPHAYFYYMLHQGIRASVSDDARTRLLAGLESGRIAPRLVILDRGLQAFSPPVTAYLEQHYEPVGKGAIWRRRQTAALPRTTFEVGNSFVALPR